MNQALKLSLSFFLLLACTASLAAQENGASFDQAADSMQQRLEQSLQEFAALQERIAGEKIPLNQTLSERERVLAEERKAYQDIARLRDGNILDLSNLRNDIKARQDESLYLASLLSEYVRNFDVSMHISERSRYAEDLDAANLASENANLSELEVFQAQAALLDTSLGRLEDAFGGTRFEGTAVDSQGQVRQGTFVLAGPTVIFSSKDGSIVGPAVERINSSEPSVTPYANAETLELAGALVTSGVGSLPFDPTLGNAQKIEGTKETLIEHIQKGGPVMVPIFTMAGIALLLALYKWVSLAILPMPTRKQLDKLYADVRHGDRKAALEKANQLRGPLGTMLQAGVEHMREPRALVEEVMYEVILTARLRMNSFLPFIAICAASAPLLGLLGTVTGIINTFKMITVFGSGDVKSLSGGISEALITTKFGLIVAIPSLLLHAFLSRKARAAASKMETAAVGLVNQVSLSRGQEPEQEGGGQRTVESAPDPQLVREQVNEILGDLLGPLMNEPNAKSQLAGQSK